MLIFFVFAFGIAWICQLPVYAFGVGGAAGLALLAVGGAAPTIGALVATRGAVWRETWRKPGAVWPLALGLVGPTAIAAGVALAGGGLAAGMPYVPSLIWPPFGEELGWRGYLQPTLDRRHGTLRASLVVGLVWAAWHWPTAWGAFDQYPIFALVLVANSVLIGWLWRAAGRSTLAGIVAHAGLNLGLIRVPDSHRVWTVAILCSLAAAAAVALARADRTDRSLQRSAATTPGYTGAS